MARDNDAVFGEWAGKMMVTLGTVNLVVAMLLVVMFFLSIREGAPSPEYLLYAAAVFTGGVTVAGFGAAIESLRRIRVAIERMT
jgi:hypothetical protein